VTGLASAERMLSPRPLGAVSCVSIVASLPDCRSVAWLTRTGQENIKAAVSWPGDDCRVARRGDSPAPLSPEAGDERIKELLDVLLPRAVDALAVIGTGSCRVLGDGAELRETT
jgi:hypothetical protein